MRYATLRSIHGVLALALASLLALYAVSGWMIIHGADGGTPKVSTLVVAVAPVGGRSEEQARVRAAASAGAERAGLVGARIEKVWFAGGAWRVRLRRVAHSAEITLTPGATEARVALRHAGFGEGVKRTHHIIAKDASGARLAWVVLIDVLSVAMLVFSLTGLLMFLGLKKERRLGWALLGASTLYTLGGIAWLALSR